MFARRITLARQHPPCQPAFAQAAQISLDPPPITDYAPRFEV